MPFDRRRYEVDTYRVIGAAMEVHKVLRRRLLESIYQEALACEFDIRKVQYEREKELDIYYKDVKLNKKYRVDFFCCKNIVVECKAVESIVSEHRMQLFNYLRIVKQPIGLLVNFGESSLHAEKYFWDEETNEIIAW